MKIGILTFHYAHNYGAVFQSYALQEYLKSLGHSVYFIDYRIPTVNTYTKKDNHRDWISKNPKACLSRLWQFYRYRDIRHRRWNGFNNFVTKYLNIIPYSTDFDKNLDCVILGSDQIWSSAHSGGKIDPVYFGKDINIPVISYAASGVTKILSESHKADLQKLLANLKAISVREENLRNHLQPYSQKEIHVVLDPTLICNKKDFEKIIPKSDAKRPYIVVYEIKRNSKTLEFARNIAAQLDADIIELTNGMTSRHQSWMREDATPEEVLGLIKNAKAMVTTSFHGTALSLKFNVPFYALRQHTTADDRIENILAKTASLERFVEMTSTPKFTIPDFGNINSNLSELIKESTDFLREALINNQ